MFPVRVCHCRLVLHEALHLLPREEAAHGGRWAGLGSAHGAASMCSRTPGRGRCIRWLACDTSPLCVPCRWSSLSKRLPMWPSSTWMSSPLQPRAGSREDCIEGGRRGCACACMRVPHSFMHSVRAALHCAAEAHAGNAGDCSCRFSAHCCPCHVGLLLTASHPPAPCSWRDILHVVDIVCCCLVLFPIVWSIKQLRDASGACRCMGGAPLVRLDNTS